MSRKNLDVAASMSRSGSEFEELDHDRDEMRFDSFGEDDRKGGDQRKLTETSLELEKKRLAQMEAELSRIRRSKESIRDLSILNKNTKALLAVAEKVSHAKEKESLAIMEWDREWQQKISSFRKQHKAMEEALKSRHLAELKGLETDLQRTIRHLAIDAPKAKSPKIPSPRSLSLLQEENMSRVVALYQKQAQERLVLASKISKQEELLIKSKNQSLHKVSNEAQAVAAKYYRQFNLPQPQISYQATQVSSRRIDIPARSSRESSTSPSEIDGAAPSLHNQSVKQPTDDLSGIGWNDSNADDEKHGGDHLRIKLGTPRFDEDSCTFLTEIECYDLRFDSRSVGNSFQLEDIPHQAMKDVNDYPDPSKSRNENLGAGPQAGSISQKMSAKHFSRSEQHAGPDYAKLGPESNSSNDAGAHDGLFRDEKAVGNEMNVAQLQNSKVAFLSQVIAPTYPAPLFNATRSSTSTKKSKVSPYLLPQTADIKGTTRNSRKSARGSLLPTAQNDAARPEYNSAARAATTLPLMNSNQYQQNAGNLSRAGSGDSRTVFPHLSDAASSISVQKDLEASTGPSGDSPSWMDSSSEKSESFLRLESWIEGKIKSILAGQSESSHRNGDSVQSILPKEFEQSLRNRPAGSLDNTNSESKSQPQNRDVGQSAGGPPRDKDDQAEDDSSNGDISNLLLRLRTTIAADQAAQDQSQKRGYFRNGIEKIPAAPVNEGLGFFNPKARRSELSNRTDYFKGQDVKQQEADPPPSAFALTEDEEEYEAKKEAERSRKEADRRNRLDEIPADRLADQTPTGQTKLSKKVGWSLGDDPSPDPAAPSAQTLLVDSDSEVLPEFRPETGQTTSSLLSRPDTSASSLQDVDSRPETSAAAEPGDFDLERDFFSLVRHNKVREFEEILASSRLSIDVRDRNGNTSLMIAAQNGHKRLVKLCLQNNAEINVCNHQGNTALHYAYSYGYTTVGNYLISKGADDTLINHQGKTCYER